MATQLDVAHPAPVSDPDTRLRDATELLRTQVARLVGRERLESDLAACVRLVTGVASGSPAPFRHALTGVVAGGKRLRPLFALAAAYSAKEFGPHQRDRAVRAAAVVELLHQASLVHDDVIDESSLRHGVATVNAQLGTDHAVLAGDYLLAHALRIGSELGGAEGVLAADAFVRMCAGQAAEVAQRFDVNRREDDYFTAIGGKTGALFEAACRIGAMAAGLSSDSTAALGTFGMRVGMSFQLLDDLLDFTATAEALGKPVGHDIVEGVYTLPLIRAFDKRPDLTDMISNTDRISGAELAVQAVRGTGTLAATRDAARALAEQAVAGLFGLGDDVRAEAPAAFAGLALALTGDTHRTDEGEHA